MSRAEKEKAELRGLVDKDLIQALDAMAMVNGQSLIALVADVLHDFAFQKMHETSVLAKTLAGNPLFAEAERRSNGN